MSGLLGKRSQSTTPTRLNGISINQSVYGNVVPLLYGTSRIPITLVDYVDFTANPQSDSDGGGKGGGGGTVSSYTYSASIVGLLCESGNSGIGGVLSVFSDQAQASLDFYDLTLFNGKSLQAPWAYMVQNHPDHAIPYDHMAYVAGANFALGSTTSLPNLSFEVQGLLAFEGHPDAEPSQIIVDYCTDPNHGIGFPYLANLTGSNSYQDYCIAAGFGISPQETTQRQAQDFISEILQLTNSNAVFTAGIGLRIVPYADQVVASNGVTFTPDLTPEYSFQDLDYLYDEGQPPVKQSIVPVDQTFNTWTVEYLNRVNQYNVDTETYVDEQDVALNGRRVAPTVTLHSITTGPVAMVVATLLCQRNLYSRKQFVFKVRADFSLLEPMDLVALNDSTAGIVNQLVRITEIDDDENDVLTITAEEMLVGPASAPYYNTELAQGYAANYEADPGNVATPYIFTAPPVLTAANNGCEEWIAVAGISGVWGGADIYASLDNVTYQHVGLKAKPSKYGALLGGGLPAGPDPDTSNSVIIVMTDPQVASLPSVSRAAADSLQTLVLVDGELIAYQNATPLGGNQFRLSYLRRGCYGSPIGQHPSGSQFAVLDDAIFHLPFSSGYAGQPVWFKFVSFNYYGLGNQDISEVQAYQAFFQGQNNGQLLAPGATPLIAEGDCVNLGSQIFKSPGSAAAWNSDCYSVNAFVGGCTARFRPTQVNATYAIGLNTDPLRDENISSLDYCWEVNADGNAYIYEGGVLATTTRAYTTNDIFEVRYDGKYITYFLSGVQWRTVPAPAKSLFFDSSFFSPGGCADNVYFGALNPANSSPFIARGQCKVGPETILKQGGVAAWDSDVYSLEGYPAAHVTWKPSATTGNFMIGLGQKPGSDSNFTSIDFAIYCTLNPIVQIYESGVLQGGYGAYSATDVFAITYDGTTITYLKNNTVLKTTVKTGLTLFMDSSFFTPGVSCNTLEFGPDTALALTDTSQLGTDAASSVVAASQGTVTMSLTDLSGSGASNDVLAWGSVTTDGTSPIAIDATVSMVITPGGSSYFSSVGFIIAYCTGNPSPPSFAALSSFTGSIPWDPTDAGAVHITSKLITTVTITAVDNKPAGTYTYAIWATGVVGPSAGGASTGVIQFLDSLIKIREYKR